MVKPAGLPQFNSPPGGGARIYPRNKGPKRPGPMPSLSSLAEIRVSDFWGQSLALYPGVIMPTQ